VIRSQALESLQQSRCQYKYSGHHERSRPAKVKYRDRRKISEEVLDLPMTTAQLL
jgi:hypothetical protein